MVGKRNFLRVDHHHFVCLLWVQVGGFVFFVHRLMGLVFALLKNFDLVLEQLDLFKALEFLV